MKSTYPCESYNIGKRRRVDITLKVLREGMEDKESEIYNTLVEDMQKYIAVKFLTYSKFQPIPGCIKIDHFETEQNKEETKLHGCKIFMIENKGHLGFKKDLMENHEGLNYEHSVLAIAALGRFHATYFCYKRFTY